jgi:hypothetical protein
MRRGMKPYPSFFYSFAAFQPVAFQSVVAAVVFCGTLSAPALNCALR